MVRDPFFLDALRQISASFLPVQMMPGRFAFHFSPGSVEERKGTFREQANEKRGDTFFLPEYTRCDGKTRWSADLLSPLLNVGNGF